MRRVYKFFVGISPIFFLISGAGWVMNQLLFEGTAELVVRHFSEGFAAAGLLFGFLAACNFLGTRFTINLKNPLWPMYLVFGCAFFACSGLIGMIATGYGHPAFLPIVFVSGFGAFGCLAAACIIRGVMRDGTYDGLDD